MYAHELTGGGQKTIDAALKHLERCMIYAQSLPPVPLEKLLPSDSMMEAEV